jgi:DNA-directed RNA polymerase specialized sigma24 family protein
MIFKDFNDYFNTLKVKVAEICRDLDKKTDYNIEYDDLFQEASLKLFKIYTENRPLNINYSLKAVRNSLIDYIRLINRNSGK